MKNPRMIILDMAGTTVDYGSFAPIKAFQKAFAVFGIHPTTDETRAAMGLPKREHIEAMMRGERLAALWRERYRFDWTQADIDSIYNEVEPALFSVIPDHCELLPGVLDAVRQIRLMGIRIGATTGYTRSMIDIIVPLVKEKGYEPDSMVCPEETGGLGRPYPYMIWRNLQNLKIDSIGEVVKIGDTPADMLEGRNAGCMCIGIIAGSSMLGLSRDEFDSLSGAERSLYFRRTRRDFAKAGADYVLNDIAELPRFLHSMAA
ncbi:MAG: phosphonoacetaldehyde hydrolase [Oscillospiraceae bacterium]|jgi:phosphonoacetaldehyde hydrolase|nr:phosphonoacetaldehyde hydrolase [Oscillospiraceae bacterium]